MRKSGLISILVLAGACASGPSEDELEEWRYERDSGRIEAEERFEELKQDCARSRGAVVVNRTFSRRMRRTPDDTELATCQPGAIRTVY